MNDEKKMRYILISTVISLLLSVLVISIIVYIKHKNNQSNILNITFNQIFVSDYELNYLDSHHFIEEDNNQIISFIDTSGKIVYEPQIPIKYTKIYPTKNNKHIIYYNENNLLEIYLFDGVDLRKIYTNEEAPYAKPIIFEQNDVNYIIGFTFNNEDNLYIYNIDTNNIITLKDTNLMADKFTENKYYANNKNYLVIKDKKDNQGVINFEGKTIIECKYKNINTLPSNYFIITNNKNEYGIIDEYNTEIVPCLYKAIANYDDYYLIVNNKNKMALYNNEFQEVIPFKMNYNETISYDYRGNLSSINLYKINNNIIVVNNYLELQNKTEYRYHNMYLINDNEIKDTLNELVFNCDDIIYTYNKDNILTIYDTSFNKIKGIELNNVKNIIELVYNNEEINKKYYDKEYNEISYQVDDIVLQTSEYYVTLRKNKTSTLEIYDLDGNLLNSIIGNDIKINSEYIIVDQNIYEIMVK